MKYDKTRKDCLACPIGYMCRQESSLNCTKCPEKKTKLNKTQHKATERKDKKHAKVSTYACYFSLSSVSVCWFVFPVLVEIVFLN